MKRNIITVFAVLIFAANVFAQPAAVGSGVTLQLDSFYAKLSRQVSPQIIDARSPEEFALNHINGAINFNLQSDDYDNFAQALDRVRPIFIYVINTGRSTALAGDLKTKGFNDVHDLQGGIANWIGSGKPYYSSVKNVLTSAAYKNIIASNKTVLVNIGSRYCPSCKKLKPFIDSLRNEYPDALKIIDIELEENPELIAKLKTVNVFPYLIVYNEGKVALKKGGLEGLQQQVGLVLAKSW